MYEDILNTKCQGSETMGTIAVVVELISQDTYGSGPDGSSAGFFLSTVNQ